LIERFMYPKYGPGQMWETVAEKIIAMGGQIHLNCKVAAFATDHNKITNCTIHNYTANQKEIVAGDYFFSTMPVKYLIKGLGNIVPTNVQTIANGLEYRDFITVGVLAKKLRLENGTINDNWIYIQEKEVQMGRIQVFNNWSPYLVKDSNTVWLGLEYFCYKDDALWNKTDANFMQFAIDELVQIGFVQKEDVLDTTILREEKTYPAYFGSYNEFDKVSAFTDSIENLFLVGRNGMHKYNNSDHSMLTAMTAVDNIVAGITTKQNIWAINTEMDYHEEASTAKA
jgi:protoporphyrinogen oxidase